MIENKNPAESGNARIFLDITNDVCPLTLVRGKLLVERMSSGQQATIYVGSDESMTSIVASIKRSRKASIQEVREKKIQDKSIFEIDIEKK